MKNKNHLVLLVALMAGACARPQPGQKLYAIDSVVTAQVSTLAQVNATLHKTSVLDGKKNDISYKADSLDWAKELEIFSELDALNKPVSRGSYLVDDGLYDPGSNLTVKAFTSKDESLPVSSLRVFYQTSIHTPRKIEAIFREKTTLYKSIREMTMEFHQLNNKTVLTSYSIQGGQKMILGDSVEFSVKGNIQY